MLVIMEKWSQIPVRRAKWSPARAIAGDKAEGAAGLGEDLRAPKIDPNSKFFFFPNRLKKCLEPFWRSCGTIMSPVRPPKPDFCAQTLFSYAFLVFLAPLWPRMLVIMEKWSQIPVITAKWLQIPVITAKWSQIRSSSNR
jgi:hypothetical protein